MDASAVPVQAAWQRAGMHQDISMFRRGWSLSLFCVCIDKSALLSRFSSLSIYPGRWLWCISQALIKGTLWNFKGRIIHGELAKLVCIRNDLDKTERCLLKLGAKFLCSTLLSMKIQKDFHVHICWGPRWSIKKSDLKLYNLIFSKVFAVFCSLIELGEKQEITLFLLISYNEFSK